MTKSNSRKKGFDSSYNTQVTLHHCGKSGQALKAGTEAEALEEHCLLACSSWHSQPAFLQNHQHRGGTFHSGLDPPTSIIKQENTPTNLSTGQSYGGIFTTKILSSWLVLSWQKMNQDTRFGSTPFKCSAVAIGNHIGQRQHSLWSPIIKHRANDYSQVCI